MWSAPFHMSPALLLLGISAARSQLSPLESLKSFTSRASTPVHRLQICNAYGIVAGRTHAPRSSSQQGALLVRHVQRNEVLCHHLQYKQCRGISLRLAEGDELDFTTSHVDIGGFTFTNLPGNPTTLLLIVYQKRDGPGTAAGFTSHAFTEHEDAAQLAVIDTSQVAAKGHSAQPKVFIQGSPAPKHINHIAYNTGTEEKALSMPAVTTMVQELPLNSVVLMKPGRYCVGTNTSRSPLVAKPMGNYVVVRLGRVGLAQEGQEFVVFPQESHPGMDSSDSPGLAVWWS